MGGYRSEWRYQAFLPYASISSNGEMDAECRNAWYCPFVMLMNKQRISAVPILHAMLHVHTTLIRVAIVHKTRVFMFALHFLCSFESAEQT